MNQSTLTQQRKGGPENPRENGTSMNLLRTRQFFAQTTLVVAGGCSGVVLYQALFPGFYYLNWLVYLPMLWGLVAVTYLCQNIGLLVIARWKRVTLPSSPANGLGFIVGMLVLVTLLVGFKVPLHGSFLLARQGLEEALEQHHDDLTQVAYASHDYGIYRFSKADRRCHHKDRVFFQFLDDGEAAIIHSESGIDDLCYNSGSKGHLFGNWYWMKED